MKKILALATGFSVTLSSAAFTALAADKAEKADLPESIYQQLLKDDYTDTNKDGIISEEEYCSAKLMTLDLDGVESIDFLERLEDPKYLYFSGGSISDFSPLAKFRNLETLQLSGMPQVTDISFVKDMELLKFYISDMEQITDEQKIAVMKFHDADTSVGFADLIGATPTGMFTYDQISLEISDTSIADFDIYKENPASICYADVYGKSAGSAEYSFKLKGKEIHKGRINVSETTAAVLPSAEGQTMPKVASSNIYSEADRVVLKDGTLYKLADGKLIAVAENVTDFDMDYTYNDSGDFISIETILFQDGTLEVNHEKLINSEGLKFTKIGRGLGVTDNGEVYSIRQEKGKYRVDLIYKGFDRFLENSSLEFISDTGEVIQIELKKNGSTTIGYQAFPTGITDVVDSYNYYFIDKDKVLWEINRHVGSEPSVRKRAEDVVYVGYRHYSDGKVYGCVHITSDGTAYDAGTTRKVILTEMVPDPYKKAGKFVYDFEDLHTSEIARSYNYHVTNENILCMEYNGKKAAVADVDSYIAARKSCDGKSVYAYFLKTDGSIWSYSFENDKFLNLSETETILKGDVNADGKFDVSDIVTFQKWLLKAQNTELKNWKAVDLCDDNILDVFDLCLMRKALIKQSSN